MEGDPGSMSAYSKAERNMFCRSRDSPGPGDYDARVSSIIQRRETYAPFDTSSYRPNRIPDGPGPIYYPIKKDLRQSGSPLFRWGERFRDKIDFSCREDFDETEAPPVRGRIPDPFLKMVEDSIAMGTKRPRVTFDKYVSNNCPTIYHPLDFRGFVEGIDGRVYPWKMNRNKMAGPAEYNTYKIHTSQSKISRAVNFSAMSTRPDLFPPKIGAGPAAYTVQEISEPKGGKFLSTNHKKPGSSAFRMFDLIDRQSRRENFGGPASTSRHSDFDACSSKCVLAPFKSKTPLGCFRPAPGPGPAAHNISKEKQLDLREVLFGVKKTRQPPSAPFLNSQPRFCNVAELGAKNSLPCPTTYTIPSFTDKWLMRCNQYRPKKRNPKMGFLISSIARPPLKGEIHLNHPPLCHCLCEKPRVWRNLRPPKGQTYRYNGPPTKFPCSPGPIYNVAPGFTAIKGRKSWWDPRHVSTVGFGNSGCARKTGFYIDKDIPSPSEYFARVPRFQRFVGKMPEVRPRFGKSHSDSPGPVYKLHEKCDSVWRASHLGTYNSFLKHVGVLFPWAGGFHKMNLNQAGDAVWHIQKRDDMFYEKKLCASSIDEGREMGAEERLRERAKSAPSASSQREPVVEELL